MGSNLCLENLETQISVKIETKGSLKQEEPININNNLNKNILFCEMPLHKEGHLLNRQKIIFKKINVQVGGPIVQAHFNIVSSNTLITRYYTLDLKLHPSFLGYNALLPRLILTHNPSASMRVYYNP